METCLWCTASATSKEDVTAVLRRYCTGGLTPQEIQDANNDLIYCMECVVEYHRARQEVSKLHKRLWELETARLLEVFREMLEVKLDDYDLLIVDNGQEQPVSRFSPEEFHNRLRFPLMEVLKYPYLLCHRDLCEMVVKVLCKMEDMNNPLPVHDRYQGTYLLMVHPNEMVRRWAIDAARSLGRVDRDSYYDLKDVFSCMFYVIDLGFSLDIEHEENMDYWCGELKGLPSHLYDSRNKKNYWLGISMLLMQLDSQAMESLFMGPQASFPQCIINTMNDSTGEDLASDSFWPALHCFMVMLDRLGSKIWSQIEPIEAFQAIIEARSYTDELENIRKNTSRSSVKAEPKSDYDDYDDPVSCSQMVYDCYAMERKNKSSDWSHDKVDSRSNVIFDEMNTLVSVLQKEMGEGMRVYGSTFLWFIPFAHSVTDHSGYIGEVLHHLEKNLNKNLLSGQTNNCDKVTELFIQILVYIIELCQNKGCLGVVSFHSYIWVKVIVQGASLSDEIYSNRTPYWRGGSSKVSSTTSSYGSLNRMAATGVGAIRQACMKLIRSLLREGVRVGTVRESCHFLNLVNRHMWGSTTKAWNLNQKESEDLQKCLKALVKAISERRGTSNDFVPCAPPTPPIDPPENTSPLCSGTDPLQKASDVEAGPSRTRDACNFLKDEPPWIDGEYHHLRGDIKTKEESLNPVPVSDFGPPVELRHLKPDFGKVQEIRAKLNDSKLSKLQNIATIRLEGEQQSECSGLRESRHASNLKCSPTNTLPKTLSTPFIEKEKPERCDDDDDDDEPLDIRMRRLKRDRLVMSDSDDQSSDDKPTSVRCAKSANVNNESGIITISDDEPVTDNTRLMGVNLPADNVDNRVTPEPPSDKNLNASPSRDFDDLSESQVFEFETQEDVPSVWRDSQMDCPVTKKLKLDTTSKASIGHGEVEPTSEFVIETQPVREEDIEKACQQAEEHISKPKQLQQPVASSLLVPSKPSSSGEKSDYFVKPKSVTAKSPPKILSLPSKTDKLGMSRKPVIIEPLGQKVKHRSRSHTYVSRDAEKPGCSATSSARRTSIPAIVPPKKVRQRAEPELPAELLGLKKKERKAFELSQRTTDSLQELRSHGQNVLVEPHQKTKRVRRNSKPQPKLAGKGGKKLLGSQDMQFFRQSREMLPKTVPSAPGPAPVRSSVSASLPKQKSPVDDVEEPDEDGDDFFLPCSQPDPDRRTDGEKTAGQAVINSSCDSNQVESRETSNKAAQRAESKEDHATDSDDEWTRLTQNEPTDMELCSQMEQMEEAYGNDIFQGDPLGMGADNQPNIADGSVSVSHKPSSDLVTQRALPATTTQDDQRLFAKPAKPPVSQSKTKPSTAKVYTSSSRIASLAKEMVKTPAVPPAANVAKAKCARPPQPAPHEFRQPLPSRPTLPLTNPPFPVAPTCNKVNLASNPPTYKLYSRPEAPVSVQASRVNHGQRFDSAKKYDAFKTPSSLKHAVLRWEYRWFQNCKQFGPSDDLCPLKLQEVPLTFSSYDEYFNIFYPLLLINLFEEMVDRWVNGVKSELKLWIQTIEYSSSIANAKFTARLTPEQVMKQLYPKEDDLVLLQLPENAGADGQDESGSGVHFGCVLHHRVYSNRGGKPAHLEVTIQTRGNVSSVNSEPVRCTTIGSMVTTLREFRGLCSAKETMEKPLLTSDVRYFTPCQEGLPDFDMPEYNRDQAKAIAYGIAMVKRKTNSPKILLIHGPPGTGKTKTIAGLLHRLLSSSKNYAVDRNGKPQRMRILVCAPSNAAIDNLMKKIIVLFKNSCKIKNRAQGTCGDINLVRVGNEKTIDEGLILFSHDSQIKKRMEKLQISDSTDIHAERGELDRLIDQLSFQCAKAKQDKNMAQFEILNAEKQQHSKAREALSHKLKEIHNKKQEIQTRLLIEAHIICCTLSKSGSAFIESAFRQLGREPFSCVIVDEAGQAKETETLIPLHFRCPSLILVGDPEQLPPTVVSQKAKELGFDQSLMARVWKSLGNSNHRPPPTVFLSMQYRMHPDICEFPSKYIYGSNLKNDCEMAQKCCSASWPFEPYRVIDVTDGRESKEGDSFSNQKEVKLVLLLLKLLFDKRPEKMRIGIITPYNAQKRRIRDALPKDECIHQVEVDTVDGFQGREMECIIVSCVRASNEMGSIGFVGNRQRMNVTITRAKFTLLILGHVRTLKEQSDWGALIDDAAKRGTIISTAEHDFEVAIQKVLKPVRLSRSYSHPPDHASTPSTSTSSASADRVKDHQPSSRKLDPRISETEAHRERDKGNQSRSHSRPPRHYSTDGGRKSSSHSSPSDPRLGRLPDSSSSSRSGR